VPGWALSRPTCAGSWPVGHCPVDRGRSSAPGLAATSLICFSFSWNEFMLAVNLTAVRVSTAPIFLVGFVSSQGLFLAKLCAAATLVSPPVLIAGFAAQDKLVRGLSLGAVK
jgi:sorbitol/mannitol transport system permease protein